MSKKKVQTDEIGLHPMVPTLVDDTRTSSLVTLVHDDQAVEQEDDVGGGIVLDARLRETLWIKNNIYRKDCVRFVKKPPKEYEPDPPDPDCYCNYKQSAHSEEALNNYRESRVTWDLDEDTRASTTNAFGEVEFLGYGGKTSKYVRLDVDTRIEKALDLLMKTWKLKKPNLLISITGGATNFEMKQRLRTIFHRGLMKAAQSTGAWIITGGTHAGVMKHVGEAVRDHELTTTTPQNKVVAIGIATWGVIWNKDALINNKLEGRWPAQYRIGKKIPRGESALDPNHSHFILVDNGTHKFRVEIAFRVALEKAISEMKTDTGTDAVSVPQVLVVVEGGPGTLETIQTSIEYGTPTVIIKGSGRAAEIIAFAAQNCESEQIEKEDRFGQMQTITRGIIDDKLEAEIISLIETEFRDTKDMDERMQYVKGCLARLDLLTIFDINSKQSSKEIDVAILKALLKDKKHLVMDQLRLALAWNRIDIAKSDIFTSEKQWGTGTLDGIMMSAIQLNRPSFVELLLDHGVSLKEFLTAERMVQLYNTISSKTLLYSMLQKYKSKKKSFYVSLKDVGDLLKSLIGDHHFEHYYMTEESFDKMDLISIMEPDNREHRKVPYPKCRMRPCEDLFLWSVLVDYPDLADIFWILGQESLVAALVGNHLMKVMMVKTHDGEMKLKFQAKASQYEEWSMGILQELYTADEVKTHKLLVRSLRNWGNATILSIAVQADNKKFISNIACQSLFTQIWRGKIMPDNHTLVLLLCFICPPLILPFIRFYESDQLDDEEEEVGSTEKPRPTLQKHKTEMSMNTIFSSEVNLHEKKKKGIQWHKFVDFYRAPVVIFIMNVLSFLTFLGLFSFVLLFQMKQGKTTVAEIVLIVWVGSLYLEEIRQAFEANKSSVTAKLKTYIENKWNVFDMVILLMFLVGMVLRFMDNYDQFMAGRFILAINVLTFFLRLLHIFSVHKELGPKLVMIESMFKDLFYFMMILFVFLAAYAVASEAILNENLVVSAKYLFIDFIRKAYFHIYGELFFDGNDYDASTTVGSYVVMYVLGFYMLIVNVLLLNLLIAMFSTTYQKIQDQTDEYWYFQRYNLIHEYSSRPPLPPPFIMIVHIYRFFKSLFNICCRRSHINTVSEFNKTSDNLAEERDLMKWEDVIVQQYVLHRNNKEQQSMDNRVQVTSERVSEIVDKIEEMQDTQAHTATITGPPSSSHTAPVTTTSSVAPTLKMPAELTRRLTTVEDQMALSFQALNWIISALQENNMSSETVSPPALPHSKTAVKPLEKKREDKKPPENNENFIKIIKQEGIRIHVASRSSPYHLSSVDRFPVPDNKVSWDIIFPDYTPVHYTAPSILNSEEHFVDTIDLLSRDSPSRGSVYPFNKYDSAEKCDRRSHLGSYDVIDGVPQNPMGRTGIIGRGNLGRWGPNHAADPILTRWMRDPKGKVKYKNGKPVLEFVAIQRLDNKQLGLPGTMADPGIPPWLSALKYEFTDDVKIQATEQKQKQMTSNLMSMFSQGQLIYQGYADDVRNTDNAWMETVAVNYHDEEGDLLSYYIVKEQPSTRYNRKKQSTSNGRSPRLNKLSSMRLNLRGMSMNKCNSHMSGQYTEATKTNWQEVSSETELWGCHSFLLKCTAAKRNAHF